MEHVVIDGVDLVGKGIDLRYVNRLQWVELVRKADAVGFEGEEGGLASTSERELCLGKNLDLGEIFWPEPTLAVEPA
jgi:hypothetical protein